MMSLAYPFILLTCFAATGNCTTGNNTQFVYFKTLEECLVIGRAMNADYASARQPRDPPDYMKDVCMNRETREIVDAPSGSIR